jgi:polyphosphate kinase 2 (PPK2 family)
VAVSLIRFEQGLPFPRDYQAALSDVQMRLASLQTRQIVHKRRAIIVLEGWSGAGKKGALKRLAATWDPCHFACHCVAEPTEDERERHWLARFWSTLPASGHTAIFYNSWHHRLVDQILLGKADPKAAARAFDEINEFENQQHEHGTVIVKLFFHLTAPLQAQRLRVRQEDPWRRALVSGSDLRSLDHRPEAQAAWERLFAQTDTRWAPWTVVDAGDKRAARIAALEAIAAALAKTMPAQPPVSQEEPFNAGAGPASEPASMPFPTRGSSLVSGQDGPRDHFVL